MPEFTFDRVVAILGIALAIVLLVLDKADKLKGPVLFWLLGLAAAMLLPLALGNAWVGNLPWGILKFSRGMFMASIVLMGYSILAIWISPSQDHKQDVRTIPPTLANLFETDFPNVFKDASEAVLGSATDGTSLYIKTHVYMDFPARTQFIAFYIPFLPSTKTFDVSMALTDVVQPMLDKLDKHVTAGGDAGGINSAQELVFSGRVFLYHEQPLSNLQKATIVEAYHAKGYDVNFRGLDYAVTQSGR